MKFTKPPAETNALLAKPIETYCLLPDGKVVDASCFDEITGAGPRER